jgi:hypothetical protein
MDISDKIRGILQRDDPFKTRRIDARNIRQITTTSTQSRLNHLNSNLNKAVPLNRYSSFKR